MERVTAFIDGFNIYHSLMEGACPHLRWLNYWTLAQAFVAPKKEKLIKVFYFSAYATFDADKVVRHRTYVRALETQGCQAILGKFKRVTRKCRADCCKKYKTFEEKETDVNIAVTLLLEANQNNFDKALLFTADSDLIAAVKALKQLAPDKYIQVILPYKRTSIDLVNCCHSSARIKRHHLERNQLPEKIELGNGKYLIKPDSWN